MTARLWQFPRRPELTPKHRHCPKGCKGALHIELRTKLDTGGRVVEVMVYRCGHTRTRIVGTLLPESHFRAIERRIGGLR